MTLTPEYRAFQESCEGFTRKYVRPVVAEAEAQGHPPKALWSEMGKARLLGLMTPEEYGGSGQDELAVALVAEELSRASGGIAVSAHVSAYMAGTHIVHYGTPEQLDTYAAAIAAGQKIAAIAVTEPGAGSDVAGISSRAIRTDSGFRINGRKMFITNAGIADVIIVAAKTDPEAGHRGITTFLVEAGTPGLSVGAPLPKMGWHSSDTREVILDDVEVPESAVLGQTGRGFYQIMGAFQLERIVLAAMGLGHAVESIRIATDYVTNRTAFGGRLIDRQAVRHRLAQMHIDLETARLLTYHAAEQLRDRNPESANTVAMAKYYVPNTTSRIVDNAVQLLGGSGFVEESEVARHYRDMRILRIGGGADEIQLDIIAKQTLARA
ncbi:acyl-CoA dehydrogenase family protein [Nocardia australiensis]|uniref:acyl-CoA dehydrogenase family protein n=1 Tax=Nocardia australiensis TaxID=2887191 RepID=UPI001D14D9ED|nr:acyl-CoA dehydrogenase family protein [Nocardia australiensis]